MLTLIPEMTRFLCSLKTSTASKQPACDRERVCLGVARRPLPEKEVSTKTSAAMQAPLMTASLMSSWKVCLTSSSNSSVPPYSTFTWLPQRNDKGTA